MKTIEEKLADARIDFDALNKFGEEQDKKVRHLMCRMCWPGVKAGDWYIAICGTPVKARRSWSIPAIFTLWIPGRCKKCTMAKVIEHMDMHREKMDWGMFE